MLSFYLYACKRPTLRLVACIIKLLRLSITIVSDATICSVTYDHNWWLELARIINYNRNCSFIVLATVITIVNYNRKTFMVQAIVYQCVSDAGNNVNDLELRRSTSRRGSSSRTTNLRRSWQSTPSRWKMSCAKVGRHFMPILLSIFINCAN